MGNSSHHGWELGRAAISELSTNPREIEPQDIIPSIKQTGVDMKIGLDIAQIATKGTAEALVLLTGDSDFIPAMKLARREGLQVFLEPLGHRMIKREMKVHSDFVLPNPLD